MLRVFDCLRTQHDWKLVIMAALVCLISTTVAILIIGRAQDTRGTQRLRWVLIAGAASGFGIWATHFVAMLAFDPGINAGYDLKLTLLSLVCAMAITGGGIEISISRSFKGAPIVGGAVIGSGIGSMHYLGMMALDVRGHILWASDLVIASIVLGIGLAAAATWVFTQKGRFANPVAALLMVLAITSHHFTAMGAVTIVPDPTHVIKGVVMSPTSMSFAISFAALAILALCVIAVMWGRKLDQVHAESNVRFRVLLEGIEDYAIFLLDTQGLVMDWNSGGDRINLYPIDEIVGRNYADVCALDPDFPRQYREGLVIAEREGRFELEGPCMRADGQHFWGHFLLRALRDDTGKLVGFANITQDITARKAAQDQLLDMSKNLDAALMHMSQGLCLFDRNERLVLANSRFFEIYKLDATIVKPGITFRDLLVQVMALRDEAAPDEDIIEQYHGLHRTLIAQPEGGSMVSDYFVYRTISISHRPLGDGGWVTTFDDITERKASEAKIEHMARHDSLTGLPNRAHFNDYLDAELSHAVRRGEQVAVITIDLDRFQEINDLLGHATGDEVLKILSQRMAEITSGDNRFAARLGGDEFAAIKRFDDMENVRACVRKLYDGICAPIEIDGQEITIGACLGVAMYPEDGALREALLNNADLALNRAKSLPGEKICFFDASMDDVARDRRALANDLDRALKNNEFCLFYQVQQSVITGQITGYEALIRWRHPTRGFVSPVDFIEVAEETGAIVPIGDWVLRTACQEAVSWNNDLKIAVNLSAVQLSSLDLIDTVRQVLIDTGLSPARLELEITETSIIDDKLRALHLLRQIKALGVTIAIDDFGTGYASLDTLNSFPFDKIKIDRSFLMEADKSSQARAIVRAILALGRSLDIPVLAEGVETESQLHLLREEGCDEAQGYLLGRPVEHIVASPPPPIAALG